MTRPIIKRLRQSNWVARSQTCPSLVAGKSFGFLLYYAQQALRKRSEQATFSLSSAELSRFLGDEPSYFLPVLKKLVDMKIHWNLLPQVGARVIVCGLSPMLGHFHYIREAEGTYTLEYSFPEPLRLELLRPKYFRFLSLKEIAKFRCKYGLKLYEFCYSFLNPQKDSIYTPWLDEDKLRALLGCESLYRAAKSFKQWVLNPAIKEINTVSEITLKLRQHGRGEGHRQFQFLITRKPRAWPNGPANEIPACCPSTEETTGGLAGLEEPLPQSALPLSNPEVTEPAQDSKPPLPDGTLPHEQEAEFFSLLPLAAGEKQLWFSSTRLVCFDEKPCLLFPSNAQMSQVLENFSGLLQTTARNCELFPLTFRSLSHPSPEDAVSTAEAGEDALNLA